MAYVYGIHSLIFSVDEVSVSCAFASIWTAQFSSARDKLHAYMGRAPSNIIEALTKSFTHSCPPGLICLAKLSRVLVAGF